MSHWLFQTAELGLKELRGNTSKSLSLPPVPPLRLLPPPPPPPEMNSIVLSGQSSSLSLKHSVPTLNITEC